jgi:RNA polymerase sigma-70 factor (ECF subfamily)
MFLHTEKDLKLFYDAHYESAVRQAFRIVNDLQEAEDVAQDCIIRLWNKRAEIAQQEMLLPYFRKMIRNRSIDVIRRRKISGPSGEIEDLEYHPPDMLEYAELSRSIDHIIDSLPEKCRQVFVLSRFEQMSYKEISEQLAISTKTVETQISRALKLLRTNLGDQLFLLFL